MRFIANVCLALVSLISMPAMAEFENLFADARTVYSSKNDNAPYRLYLGEMKKIDGEWRSENELTISGSQHRQTKELNQFISYREAQSKIDIAGKKLGTELLYACRSHDCGNSSGWANHYFGVKQLYGLNAFQNYQVWKKSSASGATYWVLYLVERGNQRIYFQLDKIRVSGSSKPEISSNFDSLLKNGFQQCACMKFKNGVWQIDEDAVQSLVMFLTKNKNANLRIVGHDYSEVDLRQQKKNSLQYAENLKQKLVAIGVEEKRLEVFGVGSLAPVRKNSQARIELILLN